MSRFLLVPFVLFFCTLSSTAQISRTPWQIHDAGYTITEQNTLINHTIHGDTLIYQYADIPAVNDPLWTAAPLNSSGNIQFSQSSRLPSSACLKRVDFTYFQTVINIPPGLTVTSCLVGFAAADDGVRVYVFNSTHTTPAQAYLPGSEIMLGHPPVTTNIASMLELGMNRIVFVQADDCGSNNNMTDGMISINGAAINNLSATALNFDGVNDQVNIGNPTGLQIKKSLSLEAWFKTGAVVSNQSLISKWHTGGMDGYGAYALSWKSGILGLSLQAENMQMVRCESGLALNDDAWHHVAATWDGVTAKIYIDGALKNTVANALFDSIENNILDVRIGGDASGNNDRYFNGDIDEVRVWGRALCIEEIQFNMNCGLKPAGQIDLRALYHFNQGIVNGDNTSFDTVIDAGPLMLQGTIMGFARTGSISNWSGGKINGECSAYNSSTSIATGGPLSFCEGGSVVLTAETASAYLWSNGATTPSITVTESGAYSVTLWLPNGCIRISPPVNVTVYSKPHITTLPTASICSNAATSLALTSGVPSAYSWTTGTITGSINGAGNGTGNNISQVLINPSNATAGTVEYVVTPTSITGGCAGDPYSIIVTVKPLPQIISAPVQYACNSTEQNYLIQSSVSGTSFSWTRNAVTGIANAAVTGEASNPITETLINTSVSSLPVVYLITPTANGCTGTVFNYTVTVHPTVTINSAATSSVCSDVAQNYIITGSVTGASYTWTRDVTAGITQAAGYGSTNVITELLTNTTDAAINVKYHITPTANACTGNIFEYSVRVNPTPFVTSVSSGSTCSGVADSYLITGNVTGTTFQWSRSAVTGISNAAAINQSTNPVNETLVNTSVSEVNAPYIITPTANGCKGADFIYTKTVKPLPVINSITNNGPLCIGTTLYLNTVATAGVSYSWTGPSGFTSSLANPTIVSVAIADSGIYTLNVMLNGCAGTPVSNHVIVSTTLSTVNAGTDKTICSDDSLKLAGTVSGISTTGVWSSSGSGYFNPSNDVLNAVYVPSATDIASGSVWLTLRSTGNGTCAAAAHAIKLAFVAQPKADAGTDQTICSYDKIVLNGSSAFSPAVTWSTSGSGIFSPAANVMNATYTPGATDINMGNVQLILTASGNATCKAVSDMVVITVVKAPTVYAGNDKAILQGQPVTLQAVVTGSVNTYAWWPLTWIVNSNQPAATVTPQNDITYSVTVTGDEGCIATDSVKINVLFPLIVPNAFSPNGDGINDKWNITNLSKYPGCTVEIFTRYGQLIYYSKGYNTPWDGLYYGKVLPAGTYYYIIDTKQGLPLYKGWLQLLR